jgi:ribosomal protein S18 acetylase RimI-like enzyme
MDLTLRRPGPDDRDFFFELRRDGFRAYAEAVFGPWDDARQRASADRDFDGLPVEIVERAGVRIGYQIVELHPDHTWLDEIVIVEPERGRGLGAALVRLVMTAASERGVPLRLSVLHVNPAQRLYARLGFRVTSVEPPRIKMEWP